MLEGNLQKLCEEVYNGPEYRKDRKRWDHIMKVSVSGAWFDGEAGCLWGEVIMRHGGKFVKDETLNEYIPANPETRAMCQQAIDFIRTFPHSQEQLMINLLQTKQDITDKGPADERK